MCSDYFSGTCSEKKWPNEKCTRRIKRNCGASHHRRRQIRSYAREMKSGIVSPLAALHESQSFIRRDASVPLQPSDVGNRIRKPCLAVKVLRNGAQDGSLSLRWREGVQMRVNKRPHHSKPCVDREPHSLSQQETLRVQIRQSVRLSTGTSQRVSQSVSQSEETDIS